VTRRRWIADESEGDRAALLGAHAAHLARVLRARIGEEFDVVAGEGARRGRVTSVSPERVEFELGEALPALEVPQVTLFLSIIKFHRMEWAIEKATELGARRIVPVIARRTDPHLSAAAHKRVARWRRIAREAAEQSRASAVPEIAEPELSRDVTGSTDELRVMPSENIATLTLAEAVTAARPAPPTISVAVGPEGGWTDVELKYFTDAGWQVVSLGPNILRSETAAVAALSVIAAEFF
jgi:16S rRNA (uracil1498-N3)-methyltransferase